MDKYLENIKIRNLVGQTITHASGSKYTVINADKDGEYLRILFVNLDDGEKDVYHAEALKELKANCDSFDSDIMNNIDRNHELALDGLFQLEFSFVKIKNSLVRYNDSDAEIFIRGNFSPLNDQLKRINETAISNKDDIEYQLSNNLFNGCIRQLFIKVLGEELGKEYKEYLKKYFIDLAKENNNNEKKNIKQKIEEMTDSLMEIVGEMDELDDYEKELE